MGNKLISKFLFIIIIFMLIGINLAYFVNASNKLSMKLLSVAEVDGQRRGSIANLEVEVKPGKGRVFIDTFPLTRLDTQISTRFAKETACKFLNRNCEYVDFFYTLRSEAPLLGGPSAGASVAVITAALIENLEIDEKTAMTGTINSGGIIGQVSGIKYKIDAAYANGIKKVVIPFGKTTYTSINHNSNDINNQSHNVTIDFVEYGKKLGIEVVYVKNLNEALSEFTGKKFEKEISDIIVPEFYISTMSNITNQLCKDSFMYQLKFLEMDLTNFSNTSKNNLQNALRLVNESLKAYAKNRYYSAASFCFGANIRFNYLDLLINYNESDKELLLNKIKELQEQTNSMLLFLDIYDLKTITDLQAYMVVRERLLETNEQIKLANEALKRDDFDSFIYRLSFANQRFRTANLWSNFFNKPGRDLKLNDNLLKQSCIRKISETQERIEYVRLSFPLLDFNNYYESISQARFDLNNGEYALCLFKASKSKAEIEIFISAIGSNNLTLFLESKIEMTKSLISRQDYELFPILAYSYFEYANLLKNDDLTSSLLYSEYALELSNLDIYFGVKGKPFIIINWNVFIYFFLGLFTGLSISFLIYKYIKSNLENPRKIPKGTFRGKKR